MPTHELKIVKLTVQASHNILKHRSNMGKSCEKHHKTPGLAGHFADVVVTEEFKNGAWQVLSVTEATCDDWTDLYINTPPMPAEEPEEPCYAPKAPSPAPPGTTPIPSVIPNCTVSTSPSDGCMGVTVSEFSMPKLFAQTTGFTVRASNFCNNKFCTTPMRMSMESCYAGTERLLLAWTAHNSWDGSSQETVGYVSEFRAGTGGIELISDLTAYCRYKIFYRGFSVLVMVLKFLKDV